MQEKQKSQWVNAPKTVDIWAISVDYNTVICETIKETEDNYKMV